MIVAGTYDPYLVVLSILVAAFASYTALDLGGHVAGGTMAGIPNHGSWAKARGRRRHGSGHFWYALHGDARYHLYRSRRALRGPRTRKSRSNNSGTGGCRHYVWHFSLSVDRLRIRAEARRRSVA